MNNLTIRLTGTNTITAQLNNAIYNNDDCLISVVGPNARLNLQGATASEDKAGRQAFQNHGTASISQCTIEASAGINALSFGEWKFDRCNVRAKAEGDEKVSFRRQYRLSGEGARAYGLCTCGTIGNSLEGIF